MKILYISEAKNADFLCDTLFHGLRSLLGSDVVDVNRLWFCYRDGFQDSDPWHTFYGLLPGEVEMPIDRTNIEDKIRHRYFDYIFYGSVHRCRTYLPEVLKFYPFSRIVFIDGEDDQDMLAFDHIEPQNIFAPEPSGYTVPKGPRYFKRELTGLNLGAIPIQFSIPREVITEQPNLCEKNRFMSPVDPRDRSTYTFPKRQEYFQQYRESYFGVTMKKGGWDCARHVEIMAAGCVPYFLDLDLCPHATLTLLPKNVLAIANQLHDLWTGSDDDLIVYEKVLSNIRFNLLCNLTTEAMASYVLRRINE